MVDNKKDQPSKFRTKNLVETKDESRGTYGTNSKSRFKNSMIRSSFYNYSDAYMHVKGTITIWNTEETVAPNNTNRKVIFQNCPSFSNCISKTNIHKKMMLMIFM